MKPYSILSILIALPLTLCAQESVTNSADLYNISLEELMNLQITTATKTSGKSDEAPAVIEIITAEQIKTRGYQHLAHILNDIANNHEDRANWGIGEPISQNVGFGFRFDTGQNILILFNGQRLNAFLPGNRFGGEEYLLNNIDRVEIIRGPGSALYGTGAFTCVINVITKKLAGNADEIILSANYIPTSNGVVINNSATLGIGNTGTFSTAFRFFKEEGQTLEVHNTLFGNAKLKDGVNHSIDGELFFSSGSLNLFSKISNQSRNTFTGFNGVNPTSMNEVTLDMYAYSAGIDKTFKVSNRAEVKIMAGWHQDNWTEVALIPQFKISADGTRLLLNDLGMPVLDTISLYRNGSQINTSFFIDGQGADTRSLDAELQFTFNFRQANNIVAGLYVAHDKILDAKRPTELNLEPLGFVPFRTITDPSNNWLFDTQASRKTLAPFAQIDYTISEKIIAYAGLRLDTYSGTGVLQAQKYTELNPRASVVYAASEANTVKMLYGTATRIPNGFETLSSISILGNPENRPERIRTYQLQWIANWTANLRTEVGGFRSTIANRLETNAAISDQLRAQGFIGQFINTNAPAAQVNNGLDGKVVSRFRSSTVAVNYTQYFASDDGHGHAIAYIPNTMINMDYTMKAKNIVFNAGFNYRGDFTKSVNDSREPVKRYLIGRLNTLYQPTRSPIEFQLTLRNMFNTTFYYPSSSADFPKHFPARGFELSVGITYKPATENL